MLGSRRLLIFQTGYTSLFDCDVVICPSKIELAKEAFYGFYLRRMAERYENFCVFVSPIEIEENPLDLAQNPFKIQYWATTETVPFFDKNRILKKMFPQLDDIWEIFDENKIDFERLYPEKRKFNLQERFGNVWQ